MKRTRFCAALAAMALLGFAQETSGPAVGTYQAIADSILATKAAEKGIVKTILDGHRHAAEGAMKRGDQEAVAAHMALFGNEGDNAVGGVKDLRFMTQQGHARFADVVLKGILQERGMVGFADVLTPEDAEAIHAYLIARGNEDYADAAAKN